MIATLVHTALLLLAYPTWRIEVTASQTDPVQPSQIVIVAGEDLRPVPADGINPDLGAGTAGNTIWLGQGGPAVSAVLESQYWTCWAALPDSAQWPPIPDESPGAYRRYLVAFPLEETHGREWLDRLAEKLRPIPGVAAVHLIKARSREDVFIAYNSPAGWIRKPDWTPPDSLGPITIMVRLSVDPCGVVEFLEVEPAGWGELPGDVVEDLARTAARWRFQPLRDINGGPQGEIEITVPFRGRPADAHSIPLATLESDSLQHSQLVIVAGEDLRPVLPDGTDPEFGAESAANTLWLGEGGPELSAALDSLKWTCWMALESVSRRDDRFLRHYLVFFPMDESQDGQWLRRTGTRLRRIPGVEMVEFRKKQPPPRAFSGNMPERLYEGLDWDPPDSVGYCQLWVHIQVVPCGTSALDHVEYQAERELPRSVLLEAVRATLSMRCKPERFTLGPPYEHEVRRPFRSSLPRPEYWNYNPPEWVVWPGPEDSLPPDIPRARVR